MWYWEYTTYCVSMCLPLLIILIFQSIKDNALHIQTFIFGPSDLSIWRSFAIFTFFTINAIWLVLPFESLIRPEPLTTVAIIVPLLLLYIAAACAIVPVLHYSRAHSLLQYLEERYHSKFLKYFATIISVLLLLTYAVLTLTAYVQSVSTLFQYLPQWIVALILSLIILLPVIHCGLQSLIDLSTLYYFLSVIALYASAAFGLSQRPVGIPQGTELSWKSILKVRTFHSMLGSNPSIWTVIPCMTILTVCLVVSQPMYQIYSSFSSKRKAKSFVLLSCLFIVLLLTPSLVWNLYNRFMLESIICLTERETTIDIILSSTFHAMQILWSQLFGVSGFMLAGYWTVHSVTVSLLLLSITTILWEDFVRFAFMHTKENYQVQVFRCLTIFLLIIMCSCTVLITLFGPNLWPYLMNAMVLLGSMYTPIATVIFIGMVFPCANSKGAIAGIVTSLIVVSYICIGMMYYQPLSYSKSSHRDSLDRLHWNCSFDVIHGQAFSNNTNHSSRNDNYSNEGELLTPTLSINDTIALLLLSGENDHPVKQTGINISQLDPLVSQNHGILGPEPNYSLETPAIFSLSVFILPVISFAFTALVIMSVSLCTGGQDIYSLDWNLVLWTCNKWSEQCRPECRRRMNRTRTRGPYVASESFRYAQHAPLPDTSYRNPRVQSMYLK